MSIADKITSITNHLTDDYVGIANLGVDLTNVDKNIQNIKSCLDGIYNDYPKTEYGEDLNVSLSNTKKGKMQIIPEGNNTQKNVAGNNLVNYDGTVITLLKSDTRTINVFPDNFPITLLAGNYAISLSDFVQSNMTTGLGIQLLKNSTPHINISNFNNATGIAYFTLSEDVEIRGIYFYIQQADSDNATCTFSKIMLNTGSTALDWEEYVGGTKSPNPAYPQYINRATGNNKFLFNGSNFFSSEIELGTIGNNNGTPASETRAVRTKDFIPVAPNTRYCISNDLGYACYLYEYDRNQKFLKFTSSNTQFSFVTMEQTRYIKFRTVASRNENDTSVKYMLNLGQTPLTWEAYTGEVLPLNLSSKNLLKPITYSRGLSAGITWDMSNGSISASGTSTAETYSILSTAVTEDMKIELLAGTYILSGASGGVNIQLISASGTALALDTGTGKTFTIYEKTICYYRGIVPNNTALDGTVIIYPQLEERKCSNNL